MSIQTCALCGASAPDQSMYLSDRGEICGGCHAADEAADRAELRSADFDPHQAAGGGATGWMIWIGVLVGINVLSAAFDWGFWIY